jgi:L-fuculose-phosphate aldolase
MERFTFPEELLAYQAECKAIVTIAQRLYQRNMLAAADGNISMRVAENKVLVTPSGVAKAFMDPQRMALITLNNEVLVGAASSERLMHLEVYRQCPEAMSVVHAHPPTAIAWSVAHPELGKLPAESLSEVILACGDIPFVPYARPGTLSMGANLRSFLPQYRALILSRHGALAWGQSLDEAWRGMERIEHSAEILWRAQQLGGLTSLPAEEVEALREMRKGLGPQLL